jgi:hypothetical protein
VKLVRFGGHVETADACVAQVVLAILGQHGDELAIVARAAG